MYKIHISILIVFFYRGMGGGTFVFLTIVRGCSATLQTACRVTASTHSKMMLVVVMMLMMMLMMMSIVMMLMMMLMMLLGMMVRMVIMLKKILKSMIVGQ